MIPPTTDLPWTPELTDLVERLWMEGKSSNQIGRMIGKTRNAVIGKVHRMGLISAHRQQPTLARVYNSPPPARRSYTSHTCPNGWYEGGAS